MGAEAAAAASMLRQDLAALAAGPEARMEIKVVLASIGAAGRPELDEIAQCIRERNGGGRAALSAMADIGRCEWWSQGIREAIVAALDESAANTYRQDGSELPVLAILALGNLGPGADSDVKSLLAKVTDMGRMVSDAGSPDLAFWWIAGALSLARVDADRRTELLSQPLFSYENGETFQVLESQCADLTDPGFVRAVTSLLASTSPGVVMHAANILGAIGPPAQGATPELLRLVDSAREERVRVAAARALGMVAPPSAAYALRLWSQRSHGRVKRALDESIQAIELAVVP